MSTGYTYNYLSPENFALGTAYVQNGLLAPTRQQFKALILQENDTMTVEGVSFLQTYAQKGLPIIISGGLPSNYASSNLSAIQFAQATMQAITNLSNVYVIEEVEFAGVLASIGIEPRALISNTNGLWYPIWRETADGDIHVFVYNDGVARSGNISFASTGTPYLLNSWTGEQTALLNYVVVDSRTIITFNLESTETLIVLFKTSNATAAAVHVTSTSGPVLGLVQSLDGIWAKYTAASNETASVTLSNGNIVNLSVNGCSSPRSV